MNTAEITPSLKKLAAEHANSWVAWYDKLMLVAKATTWSGASNLSMEDATAEDFAGSGYDEGETAALMFVMTQDHYGVACDSVDQIDRWFSANVGKIGRVR